MEWSLTELEKVLQIRTGTINPAHYPEETFELYSIPGFDNGRPELLRGADIRSNKTNICPGDVLFSKLNPRIPRVWIVPPKAEFKQISSTEFWPLVWDQRTLDPYYLRYYLLTPALRERLCPSTEAATKSRSRIKPFQLLGESIPLPPLSEQRRIVESLDQVDRLRRLRAEADAKAERILPALFIKMFGDPATAFGVARLGDLLRRKKGALQSGPFGTHLHNSDFVPSGTVLAVGIDNVLDGEFVLGRNRRITSEKYEELTKYTLERGDVLITVMGTVGRTCVFPGTASPAICTKHVYRIQLDKEIHPEYLSAMLRFSEAARAQIGAGVTGQIVAGIKSEALRRLQLSVPPRELQAEFVARKGQIDSTRHRVREAMKRFEALFSVLVSRAFSGSLTAF